MVSFRALVRANALAFVLGAAGGWALSTVVVYALVALVRTDGWRPTEPLAVAELSASLGGLGATALAVVMATRRTRRRRAVLRVSVATPLPEPAGRPTGDIEVWLTNGGESAAREVRLAWSVGEDGAAWLAAPPPGWKLEGGVTCHGATWALRRPLAPGARLHLGPFHFQPGSRPRRAAVVVTAANSSPQFDGLDL
jgi:hypothetical protein